LTANIVVVGFVLKFNKIDIGFTYDWSRHTPHINDVEALE